MYDLVWSKPMSKVAQDFNISDVALKKICQKHRVPSPPRGYWAKKAAGKPVKQVRLVETADPVEERITIFGSNRADLPAPVREIIQRARASRATRRPSVTADLDSSITPIEQIHPAIASTAKRLRKQKPDKNGVVSAALDGCCGIDIAASSVERCLNLLDALARSFTAQGVDLVPAGNAMAVTTSGEKITFALKEYVRRDKHVPTLDELAAEERRRKRLAITWDSPYDRAYPEWDFVRTGELFIEIENRYVSGLRRTWKDGRRQRLENLIDEIAAGIIAYAVAPFQSRENEGLAPGSAGRHRELGVLMRLEVSRGQAKVYGSSSLRLHG